MARKELFDCEVCKNSQPLPQPKSLSVKCIKCETNYAIVQAETEDGSKVRAVVPYFHQNKNQEA